MPQSNPASGHAIGLFVSVCTLPAAILLAVRMTSPVWWPLPIAAATLIAIRLRMFRAAKRQAAQATVRPAHPAHSR